MPRQQDEAEQLISDATPRTLEHGAEAKAVEDTERICVVCLTEPVGTIALPCRHSVLCEVCMGQVRTSSGRCPICRAHIDASVLGLFPTEFVDLSSDVVSALAKPLARVQAAVYERMYDHIRVFLFVGAVAGAGAVACFLVPPLAFTGLGIPLAVAAVAVGYLPWLAVSISAFEQSTASDVVGVRARLFTAEDWQRPFVLVTKAIVLLIGAPVAVAVFFAPYACYTCVLRPFGRHVVPVILRGLLRVFIDIVCYSYMYVLRPVGKAIWWTGCAVSWVLSKAIQGMCWLARAAGAGIHAGGVATWEKALVPFGQACGAASTACYDHVLVPIGQGAATGASNAAGFVHGRVLRPAWNGLTWILTMMGRGLAFCAREAWGFLYHYALVPLGNGLAWSARMFGRGCCLLYEHVLVPGGRGIASAAAWLFMHVIQPTGRALGSGIAAVGRGIAELAGLAAHGLAMTAGAIFLYVLAPTGRAIAFVATKIAGGMAAAAHGTYVWVLAPVGVAIATCGRAAWYAASAVASAFATGLSAAYAHVLVPLGQGIAAGAVAVRDAIFSPLATLLSRVGRLIVDALHAVGAGLQEFGERLAGLAHQARDTIQEALRSVVQIFSGGR